MADEQPIQRRRSWLPAVLLWVLIISFGASLFFGIGLVIDDHRRMDAEEMQRMVIAKPSWKTTAGLAGVFTSFILLLPLGPVVLLNMGMKPTLAKSAVWVAGVGIFVAILLPALARAREKPVIYLYPPTEMTVNVKVHYDGIFTETIPAYPKNGWTVVASPAGELTDPASGAKYPYLFWEGIDSHHYAMPDGFVIPGSDSAAFLTQTLSDLGLSPREIADFAEYWSPRLSANRYNFIHFATDAYTQHVPLEVTPKPDTVIRVFMLFRALDAPITVAPQHLTRTERTGFTVVEWGGTELKRWQFTRQ